MNDNTIESFVGRGILPEEPFLEVERRKTLVLSDSVAIGGGIFFSVDNCGERIAVGMVRDGNRLDGNRRIDSCDFDMGRGVGFAGPLHTEM